MKKIKKLLYLKLARKMNKNGNASSVPTIVSEDSKIIGNLISSGVVHVDGRIEGDVCCDQLVVGIKGSIKGLVQTEKLDLYGTLQGKANVDDLFIAKSAKMIGDATHNSIAIEPGAYIDGSCIRADRLQPSPRQIQQVSKSSSAENRPTQVAPAAKTIVLSVGSANNSKRRIAK
ncbi:MAG: polymer-forming cytoskeletal protein [Alphaproteobacteria bacterium]|nr:polymer-forming cytoskeletal protein [Alphaproteobacteria bacterium]